LLKRGIDSDLRDWKVCMHLSSLPRCRISLLIAIPVLVCACGGGGSGDAGSGGGGGSPSGSASGGSGHGGSQSTSTSTSSNSGGSGTGGSGGSAAKGTLIKDFTGANANIADDPANLTPLGWVRDYHNWGWICDNYASGPAYPNMLYTFMNFNGWDWDTYYKAMKTAGVQAFPAVQGGVPWMNNSAIPPVASGADPTKAASYIAHGDTMYQIAARYGSTQVPDAKLKLKANQTRVSGLDTVHYFEDFNEQDNAAGFTGDVFAAMASADYDGDQGRLGDTIGVKNADPNAKLVMGGLSGKYPTSTQWVQSITGFLDAMIGWSNANRAGSFPADVINVHLYSFGPGGGAPAPSPEDDHVKDKLAAITAYRDQKLPGKEVWWTEFGYDTYDTSILRAPAIGPNSAFVVQGQWLIRDFLAAMAAGIDRTTLFELDDTCDITQPGCNAAEQFTTCGLIDGKGNKKVAWYYVAAFRSRLATTVFDAEVASGDPNVMVYRFKDTTSAGGAFVVWAPTSSAKVVSQYRLTLPAGTTSAKQIVLADQQPTGVETTLTIAGGKVQFDVDETPTIILVDAI
jgi:hypothetical protein